MATVVHVLITRPAPQGDRLAERLRMDWGDRVAVTQSPLMTTVYLTPEVPPGPFAAVILTSEVGALAARHLRGLPRLCHCVGTRTAEAAQESGFRPGLVAPTAAALVSALLAEDTGPLLYLHGRDVSVRIDQLLAEAGRTATAAVVYDQQETPLNGSALALLRGEGPVVAPLYSVRSVRLLVAAMPPGVGSEIWPCAISEQVALALPDDLRDRCAVAETPDGAGMMSALQRVISSLLG